MNKIFLGVLIVIAVMSSAYAAEAKSIVIFFSRADENYNVGYIKTGNTKILADMIAEKTGSDIFEVRPAKSYPADYNTCIDVAKKELNSRARPAIAEDKDISEYDTIFLGYPIWWGDLPMCMYTFLEAHDLKGKTIAPFATHEGSGIAGTDRGLERVFPGAKVTKGLAVRGSTAQKDKAGSEKSVNTWLKSLGF